MKITDFSLIFIAIIIPFILVLYVNITFTIKAEEMEMYYQNILDAATSDAAYSMKQIESEDKQIDFGYSDKENKKVNVNAQVGVDSFFESLYNNFKIIGNEHAQEYLNLFVPAVAVIEYDGVRISKNETVISQDDGTSHIKRILKPKTYYTFTYSIIKNGDEYKFVPGQGAGNIVSLHTIELTLDKKIVHRGYNYILNEELEVSSFYIDDEKNNEDLVAGVIISDSKNILKSEIVSYILENKQDIISNVVEKELNYAVNENNLYARQAGITYTFSFPATTQDDLYGMIDSVGIVAFVQGISIGNKYLNTSAIGMSTLSQEQRYYFTVPNVDSQIQMNLYHKDIRCPEYRLSKVLDISPRYATSKQQAATSKVTGTVNGEKQIFEGFYPCPICNP